MDENNANPMMGDDNAAGADTSAMPTDENATEENGDMSMEEKPAEGGEMGA